jgi:hypothetical protein
LPAASPVPVPVLVLVLVPVIVRPSPHLQHGHGQTCSDLVHKYGATLFSKIYY